MGNVRADPSGTDVTERLQVIEGALVALNATSLDRVRPTRSARATSSVSCSCRPTGGTEVRERPRSGVNVTFGL